jgi:hypothetical protein
MISRPPTPGRATAANADNDAGTNSALTVCSRNDPNADWAMTSCAGVAIPEAGNLLLKPVVTMLPRVSSGAMSAGSAMPPARKIGAA